MHQKYGKDGLVCVSVSVDETKQHKKALEFLKKVGASFPNYLLDAEPQAWQDKWDLNGPPAVFVFDRNNERAAKFDTSDPDKPYTYDDVEAVVRKLLNERK
ncbi:MAG: hypothetical protein K2R98_27700 [Gemmataceae bacterium]|nr:hypothetical protein [Gemmataceae bacterium]